MLLLTLISMMITTVKSFGMMNIHTQMILPLDLFPPEMITTTSSTTTSSLLLLAAAVSETEAWVEPLRNIMDPSFNLLSFAMLCRVVISWYPETNVNELPYNIVVWPTEPLLKFTRGVVPPAFGVDISPIVWLGVFTFLHEIFLGQQGLLTLKIKYGI